MSDTAKIFARASHYVAAKSQDHSDDLARRTIDIVLVLLALPMLVTVFAVIAIASKITEPGEPVFFKARRFGKNGKPFSMYKFRTMSNDPVLVRCEAIIRQFDPGTNFKLHNDPRVSRLGAFLRRCHLDELPQLFNVLLGDMTLVGPRPNSRPVSDYEGWQLERLSVRPGVTGPWQVYGDRGTTYSERFAEDVRYVRTRTGRSDAKILLETLLHCVRGKGLA